MGREGGPRLQGKSVRASACVLNPPASLDSSGPTRSPSASPHRSAGGSGCASSSTSVQAVPRTRRAPGAWLAAGKHRGKCLRRHVNQLLSMPRHTPVSPRRQPRASPGATGEVLKVGAWSSFSLSPRGRVMALGPGQGCDHRAWRK